MNRNRILPLLVLFMLVAAPRVEAQSLQKLAQTGMKFLSVSNDPRAAALGNSVMSIDGLQSALFYNPAAMSRQNNFANVFAGNTQWIAGIEHNHASLTLSPMGGRYGVIGFTMQHVTYGDFQRTVRWDNDQGYRDIDHPLSPSAFALGVGYARAITDRFSVGGHIKYAHQDLGQSAMDVGETNGFEYQDNALGTMAFDFGVLYHTGFRSLAIAMAVRNFSQEIRYEDENFQLPLNFHMGISMDVIDLTNADPSVHSLLVAIDANRPRDYSEMITFGTEYTFLETFMLRAGYAFLVEGEIRSNDQQGASIGAGVRQTVGGVGFGADYAYTQFGIFSDVHRVAIHLSF
jgi:hypothetical protein